MASIWDYEARVSRRHQRQKAMGWTRRAIFHNIPKSQALTIVPTEYSPWPGESGKGAAVLVQSDSEPDHLVGTAGRARVTLLYRPLTWEEWLELHPDHGVILGQSSIRTRRVIQHQGLIVEGQDWNDTTGAGLFHVIDGENEKIEAMTVVRIHAVVQDKAKYIDAFVDRVGKYNADALTALPHGELTPKPGLWLLSGMKYSPRPTLNALWTCEYDFMLNDYRADEPLATGVGWAYPCTSLKYSRESRAVLKRDVNGDVIYDTQVPPQPIYVSMTFLVPKADQTMVQLNKSADLSVIMELLESSW